MALKTTTALGSISAKSKVKFKPTKTRIQASGAKSIMDNCIGTYR
jgi:hypothetical protein